MFQHDKNDLSACSDWDVYSAGIQSNCSEGKVQDQDHQNDIFLFKWSEDKMKKVTSLNSTPALEGYVMVSLFSCASHLDLIFDV